MNIKKFLRGKDSNTELDEKAIPFDVMPHWNAGAPMPNVFSSEWKKLLSFITDRDLDDGEQEIIALVEFKRCIIYKFGSPNDEVLGGHRLYKKGLKFYGAHVVENSEWLNEIKQINSIHPRHDEKMYKDMKHYVFCFHDSTFECLAEGYTIETFTCKYNEFLTSVILERLKW